VARRILLVLKCSFMSAITELTQQIDSSRPLTAVEGEDGELYVDWQKTLRGDEPVNSPESDRWNELLHGQYILAYHEDGPGYWYDRNSVLEDVPGGTP
jgi:hypothetical protein